MGSRELSRRQSYTGFLWQWGGEITRVDWDTLPKARDTMDCISDLLVKGGGHLVLFVLVLDPNLWFLMFMSL